MAKSLVRENLSTQLYNSLRTGLMDGQFSPGQRLTIAGIAEEYSTSITPVREAIFRLVSERALEMRAATSVQVPNLKPESLHEIQKIRIELEGLSAFEVAKKITREELEQLQHIHTRFIEAAGRSGAEASILNRDFHFALLRLSGMPILESICENMWVLMGPFLRMFHDRMPVREIASDEHKHHELLEALAAGDAERSRMAIQADILWGRDLFDILETDGVVASADARQKQV